MRLALPLGLGLTGVLLVVGVVTTGRRSPPGEAATTRASERTVVRTWRSPVPDPAPAPAAEAENAAPVLAPSRPPDLAALSSAELALQAAGTADPWLQAEMLEELTQRRAGEALATAVALLRATRVEVRLVALDAIKDLGEPAAVESLRRALPSEPDPRVQSSIREALAGLADEPAP